MKRNLQMLIGIAFLLLAAGAAQANVCSPPAGANCFFLDNGPNLWLGTAASECVNAAGGNDMINGAGGDDYVNGGAGDDRVFGGSGDDCVIGGTGNDTLFGGAGNDTLDATTDGVSGESMTGGPGVDGCVDEGLGVFC